MEKHKPPVFGVPAVHFGISNNFQNSLRKQCPETNSEFTHNKLMVERLLFLLGPGLFSGGELLVSGSVRVRAM